MSKAHEDVLQSLKKQVKWKRKASAMLRRIHTLSKSQTLSVRQYKVLRKLRTKERVHKMKVGLEEIADLFPGKSMSTLKCALEDLSNRKIFN